MEISVNGLGLGVTDRFRDYVTEKAEKVSHLAEKALAFEVKASRHNEKNGSSGGDDRVELTLIGPGPLVRAESNGSDKYVAFDLALDKLMERLRRAKDRTKVHRGQHRPTSLREATANGFRVVDITPADPALIERVATGSVDVVSGTVEEVEEPWSPVVIRKKVFAAVPMTVDDALYYMELVGHDFYLFIDAETDRPSVVYRRKGWDYGVIGLDAETVATQEAATASKANRR